MTEQRPEKKKPVDVGNGLVCASLDHDGAWLSFGTYHPRHGFLELTGLPPFDERRRGDPASVRGYRGLMVEPRLAFLRLEAEHWAGTVSTTAPAGRRSIEQQWTLTPLRPDPDEPSLVFRGRLDRPAFAEITETDPLPPTGATTALRTAGRTLHVEARELPAAVEIDVEGPGGSWAPGADGAQLVLGPHTHTIALTILCSLRVPAAS